MMNTYVQLKLQHRKSALISSLSRQKLASSRSCAVIVTKRKHDDYNSDNETSTEALPLLSKDTCETGTPADPTSEPIMSLFKIPTDNIDTIRRLHFELFKKLQTNNNATMTYTHPMHPESNLSHALIPRRKSRSANMR